MKISTRLCAFFLTSLAVILVAFSALLYFMTRLHLTTAFDAQLSGQMETVQAAIEFEPLGLVWEPEERRLTPPSADSKTHTFWLVETADEKPIHFSGNIPLQSIAEAVRSAQLSDTEVEFDVTVNGESWKCRRKVMHHVPPSAAKPLGPSEPAEAGVTYHKQLTVTVGESTHALETSLKRLAVTLVGLTLIVWSCSAIAGTFLSKRALLPLTEMANAARAIEASDQKARLPAVATEDELQDLAEAFNGVLERMQQAYERQLRFAGDASHQLRTPLTSILGHVEVALRRTRKPEEYIDVLQRVKRQSEHLHSIIESLLFLARSGESLMAVALEKISIHDWLNQHMTKWQDHERAEDFRVEHEGLPKEIETNSSLLAILIDVFLDNAILYSEPGKCIRVHCRTEPTQVMLQIADEGTGIDSRDLSSIFRSFYRGANARTRGLHGAGLGLSIAERIAKVLNARIEVESTKGAGSQFRVILSVGS